MKIWRVGVLFLAAAAAAAAGASCVLGQFELVGAPDAGADGAVDAGKDGQGDDGGDGAPPGCQRATAPPPPAQPDPGPDDVWFVVGLKWIDFGETKVKNGPEVGYDLDKFCTCCKAPCPDEGPSCKYPAWATDGGQCDGPGGRDNSVSEIFAAAGIFADNLTSESQNKSLLKGNWSLLVRIAQYNGKANDAQVEVAIFPSPGLGNDDCLGPDPKPKFDGSDRWPVSATALEKISDGGKGDAGACANAPGYDLSKPKYIDQGAYVNNWVVVANLPEAGLEIAEEEGTMHVTLAAGFVAGRIEKQADGYHLLDAGLGGMWKLNLFFETLGKMTSGGKAICTDHSLYPLLKQGICSHADILSKVAGPTTPCDSISFGMALEAVPAQLGRIVEVGQSAGDGGCPPETNPGNDNCDTKE
ncbi:MAG: hypothetical protein HY744_09475 [Deltaproteobacteria bacterium]|nr:hypothetical protein [Deltaproteobacteria bacterium]